MSNQNTLTPALSMANTLVTCDGGDASGEYRSGFLKAVAHLGLNASRWRSARRKPHRSFVRFVRSRRPPSGPGATARHSPAVAGFAVCPETFMRRLKETAPAEQVLEVVTPRTNAARLNAAERLFGSLVLASGPARSRRARCAGDRSGRRASPVPGPHLFDACATPRRESARHRLSAGWTPPVRCGQFSEW